MRRSRVHIILGVLALLLASCGQRYEAKQLVKAFVKEHATEEIDISSFSDLDSTKVISDSLLQVMRQRAEKDTLFKDVKLGSVPPSTTLLYIRMRYGADSLNQSRTFYFDRDLTGIVAFK
ncbi:MAG: hypothetical protein J6V97_06030 [Prevotella sp.]|nr:hypothetical protein [Prevotella sp.]